MMTLIKCEWNKIKHLNLFVGFLLICGLNVAMNLSTFHFFKQYYTDISLWEVLFSLSAMSFFGMLFPLFGVYFSVAYSKMESDQNGMQWLLLMPYKKLQVYLVKRVSLFLVGLLGCLVYSVVLLVTGKVLGIQGGMPLEYVIKIMIVYGCQYLLLLMVFQIMEYTKSLLASISIGLLLVVSAFVLAQTRFYLYIPYCYGLPALDSNLLEAIKLLLIDVAFIFTIMIIDFFYFINKDNV